MESIKVGIKLRPILSCDSVKENLWNLRANKIKSTNGKYSIPFGVFCEFSKIFKFTKILNFMLDTVYNEETTNEEIYENLAKPIVSKVIDGFNGTIFAYGQTSSGKTYTMMGNSEKPGLATLAIDDIFNTIDNSNSSGRDFIIRIGYIEIYNDKIYDLFNDRKNIVNIFEVNGTVTINQREFTVINKDEVMTYFQRGNACKKTAETKFNEISSRSHTIFRITIESNSTISYLYLVDLAGSERPSASNSVSFNEGLHINKSLLALGKIIRELGKKKKSNLMKASFRECRLTRILLPALSGSCLAAVVCTVAPNILEESYRTICFAQDIKKVKTYQRILTRARTLLKGASSDSLESSPIPSKVAKEIRHLRAEIEKLEDERVKATSELRDAKVLLNHRETMLAKMETRLVTSETMIDNIRNQQEMSKLKNDYEQRLKLKEKDCKNLEMRFEKEVKDLNRNLKLFEDATYKNGLTIKKLQTEIKQMENENGGMKKIYEKKLKEAHSEYGKVMREKTEKLEELESKLEEVSIEETDRKLAEAKLFLDLEKNYSSKINEIDVKLKSKNDEISNLRMKIATIERQSNEQIEILNKFLQQKLNEIKLKDDEIEQLKRKIKEQDDFKNNLDLKELEIKKLTSKLNEAVSENESIRRQSSRSEELEKKIENLETDYEIRMKDFHKKFSKLLNSKENEISKLKKILKRKNNELADLQHQIDYSIRDERELTLIFEEKLRSIEGHFMEILQEKNAEIEKLQDDLNIYSGIDAKIKSKFDPAEVIYEIECLKTIFNSVATEMNYMKISPLENNRNARKVSIEIKRFQAKLLGLGFKPPQNPPYNYETDEETEDDSSSGTSTSSQKTSSESGLYLDGRKLMRGSKCPYCNREFVRKFALTRHIRIKHLSRRAENI